GVRYPVNHDIFSIQESLLQALLEAALPSGASASETTLERPKDRSHGDFATPVAMILAKKLKRPPLEIAKEIAARLQNIPDLLSRCETVPPGFINFTLNAAVLYRGLEDTLKKGGEFGKNTQRKGKKILLEFVSANPTGP